MEAVPVEDLEVKERIDQAEPPPLGADAPHLQIPAPGSGAWLGFLLGMAPSRPASIAAPRSSFPPVAAGAGTRNTRKRGRQPSSDGDAHRQNKGKQKRGKEAAGDAQRHKEKSPCETRTSCSSQAPAESVNEISDDEVEEVPAVATRRLTSDVWLEMTKKMLRGKPTAIGNYCHKELTAGAKSGTSHLRDHLKICTQRMLKLRSTSGKSLCQSQLRVTTQAEGKVNVESYNFDQEICREELGDMIVLHDYPLSIVDHAGFRRFVHALHPLFKLHTRNTIRKHIIARHDKEKMKAIKYMTMLQSRVAVTTDMWTSDNQKKGYMAVTGHFIDESWKLRSILMGFIYVPAPHTGDVIAEELHETLMQWNLDEKLLTVTVDNCTSNDKAVDLMISKIGKSKLLLQGTMLHMRCCAHILNLVVKDGLDVMKSAIHNIRESVAYWTATPKRVEKFEEMAKAIFERAKIVDKQYETLPTSDEWDFAAMVVPRLSLFYEITTLFSGTDYVIANVFFPKICEIKMKIR
ncbi:hypothetical protein ACQ4PT_021648 [Festuca glaucescens]